MDIQTSDITLLILIASMIIAVIFFNHVDQISKKKMLAWLYKDAPFYRAHLLVNDMQQLKQSPDDETAAALAVRMEQYLLFNCAVVESDEITVKRGDYVRWIQAERLVKQEIELMHRTMSNEQRVGDYANHRIDVVNFAEQHDVKLFDGGDVGFDAASAKAKV